MQIYVTINSTKRILRSMCIDTSHFVSSFFLVKSVDTIFDLLFSLMNP